MELLDNIKRIVENYINSKNLSDVVYGTLTNVSPLTVKIDSSQITIAGAFLIVPESMTEHTRDMTINGVKQKVIVHSELRVGDKVILVKKHGGQLYAMIGKGGW